MNNNEYAKKCLGIYREMTNATYKSISEGTGIAERRVRGITRERTMPSDTEAVNILRWLQAEGFDYIPPEQRSDTSEIIQTEKANAPIPKNKSRADRTDAISIKGSAKQNALDLKRLKNYKHDYIAATVLVRIGWETVIKVGLDNFDFTPYE